MRLALLLCAVVALHFVADAGCCCCCCLHFVPILPPLSCALLPTLLFHFYCHPSCVRSLWPTVALHSQKFVWKKNSCHKIFGDFPVCFLLFLLFLYFFGTFRTFFVAHCSCITALIVVACSVLVAFAARQHFYWASCRFRFHIAPAPAPAPTPPTFPCPTTFILFSSASYFSKFSAIYRRRFTAIHPTPLLSSPLHTRAPLPSTTQFAFAFAQPAAATGWLPDCFSGSIQPQKGLNASNEHSRCVVIVAVACMCDRAIVVAYAF